MRQNFKWKNRLELIKYSIENYNSKDSYGSFEFLIKICKFNYENKKKIIIYARDNQSDMNQCFEILCDYWNINPPDKWLTFDQLFKMRKLIALKKRLKNDCITKENIDLLLGCASKYINPDISNEIITRYKYKYNHENCLIKNPTPLIQSSYFYENKRTTKKEEVDRSMITEFLIKSELFDYTILKNVIVLNICKHGWVRIISYLMNQKKRKINFSIPKNQCII